VNVNVRTNGSGSRTSAKDLALPAVALEATLSDLQRRFGETVVMRLGESRRLYAEAISTGFPTLDAALGIGGVPRGRITDIYGPESSGKTTLCLHIIAGAQKQGGICLFIDIEHALDPLHAVHCGVNLDDLYIAQPGTGEEALEIAEAMMRAGLEVVVIDSAAALLPRAELEGEMGDNHAGLQASLMSQTTLSPEKVWELTLGQLQLQMTQATFDSWVKGSQFISANNGTWQIGVKSAFAKDWLENRLLSTISRTVSGIAGSPVQLEFVLDTAPRLSCCRTGPGDQEPGWSRRQP
jgi:hypothetical protein